MEVLDAPGDPRHITVDEEAPHTTLTGGNESVAYDEQELTDPKSYICHLGWKAVAIQIGNILEWYDFGLFGFFASEFATIFFPQDQGLSHSEKLASVFAIFGAAYLMRPVGGVLFGYIGDTHGRKQALVWSISLMAIPTFLMGCIPTYEQIGWWAPFFLCIIRLCQGISVGGELVGTFLFSVESAPAHRRGLEGSYCFLTVTWGFYLARLLGPF